MIPLGPLGRSVDSNLLLSVLCCVRPISLHGVFLLLFLHSLVKAIYNLPRTYHKRWLAGVAILALVGAGTATALVSLGPDASQLSVKLIIEDVIPSIGNQTQALEQTQLRLYRSDTTRSSDSASSLLARLGISDPKAEAFLRSHAVARQALLGRAGRWVSVEADNHQRLVKLTAKWTQDESSQFQKLVITQDSGALSITLNTAPLTASIRMASGTIQSSLFAATDDARIPDSVAIQLADVFSGDIDFHRALRKGDRFSVVYETLEADGEPVRSGRVLSAEFVNNGKSFQAMWFEDPNNARKGAYYNLDGLSLRRAYLASPLAFSRVTSGFKMRFHPILQTWRAHLGVDYAAPTGTPVRSVGDGVVETAASLNGLGNVVIISHRSGHSTVYAHLSKIQVKKGQRIAQGQTVGLVGATGWATGPHLHFEFRINGQHKDPQLIARQSEADPVLAASKPEFMRLAQSVRQQLVQASTVQMTSTQ